MSRLVNAAIDVAMLFESCDVHLDGPCPVCRLRYALREIGEWP